MTLTIPPGKYTAVFHSADDGVDVTEEYELEKETQITVTIPCPQ